MRVKSLQYALILALVSSFAFWFCLAHPILPTAEAQLTTGREKAPPAQVNEMKKEVGNTGEALKQNLQVSEQKVKEREEKVKAQETKSEEKTDIQKMTGYSPIAVYLVAGLLALLGAIFFLLFWWSSKLDQGSYLGGLFYDSVKNLEYNRVAVELSDKWKRYDYHREVLQDQEWRKANEKPPVPTEFTNEVPEISDYILLIQREGESSSPIGRTPPPGLPPRSPNVSGLSEDQKDSIKREEEISKAREMYRKSVLVWFDTKVSSEANKRYKADQDEAQKVAIERANKATNFDFSVLRGRGPEFVLEFTTIVVIIFAAMALGILGILKSEQIGTLLAAIAGYVLGRAVTGSREPGKVQSEALAKTLEMKEQTEALAKKLEAIKQQGPPKQQETPKTPKTPETPEPPAPKD